jgi:hypothetical protein
MVGRLILAALLAAGLLAAQGKGGSKGGGSNNMGPSMGPARAQSKLDQIADKLKLNKEQKDELQSIMNGALEAAGPLNQQIQNGRQQIAGAMVNGKDSGDDYTKLIGAYTAVLAQMDTLESTAYAKIYALLKPNQQKNGEQVFTELMAGIFMQGGRGGGGRRKGGE